jgi:DtxR family Mn-dependent transcriptional regulator
MTESLIAVFVIGLLAGTGLGWLWCSRRAPRWSDKSTVEDALKHLYECEYREQRVSVEGLAGSLDMPADEAARLVAKLEDEHLVQFQDTGPRLTSEGRRYALRMIRVHRLWEHYLAERTGFAESEWHDEADAREHRISPDEADALSASMGHPRYDPHGDPIPTAEGEVPPVPGQGLSTLSVGEGAVIVHVEDEPAAVYAQLLALGLSRGVKLVVTQKTSERVGILVDGREQVLAPIVAANLSVDRLPQIEVPDPGSRRLSDLEIGQRAAILSILPACRGAQRRRLLDLGLLPGTIVEAELRSPGGEPTAYRVRGALIALRRDQTDLIRVRAPGNRAATP